MKGALPGAIWASASSGGPSTMNPATTRVAVAVMAIARRRETSVDIGVLSPGTVADADDVTRSGIRAPLNAERGTSCVAQNVHA